MHTQARYYDGRSAGEQRVTVRTDGVVLQVDREGGTDTLALADVTIVPPVGRGAWSIDLPDGGRLSFLDTGFGEFVSGHQGSPNWIGKLEGSWHWALIALVVAVLGTVGILNWGLPAAARHVAFAVPPEVEANFSDDSLAALDRVLFSPSHLDETTMADVRALFDEIVAQDPEYDRYQLIFRDFRGGPNAFALPGGVIVMTDGMVELAESTDELAAVLAHEVGHQANRHLLRIVLQDSVGALLVASLTGDLTSVTALAASIPAALMQAKYSRDFEREADAFAFDYLASQGRDPAALRELLLRLERRDSATDGSPGTSWFSSHPRSEERSPARREDD